MSANKSPWEECENTLLGEVVAEMPHAHIKQIWKEFSRRNFRERTENSVKFKVRALRGGSDSASDDTTMLPPLLSAYGSSAQYSSIPGAQRLTPLHPLIAQARRHFSEVAGFEHATSVDPVGRWASILGAAAISMLDCSDTDKAMLKVYMGHLLYTSL